jgi:(2R)-3-sulfolactate dehydrogenase (NADP+)
MIGAPDAMTNERLSIACCEELVVRVLGAHDTSAENAISVARALVAAEADGQRGHGLSRVPAYAAQARSGKVRGRVKPEVSEIGSASVRVDAALGFAYPALDLARHALLDLLPSSGIAAASVTRSHHFGQAGYHVERLAEKGALALIFGNSPQAIAPWGGRRGVFGTNPIAMAAPLEGRPPLVIDLSLARSARANVVAAKDRGETIPGDWALDEQGRPTTDPEAALRGTMLPIGGAKGVALVMIVEILAAALGGANFGFEASSFFQAQGDPPAVGQLLLAFDPATFSGGAFNARMSALLEAATAETGTRLPGERRLSARRRASSQGVLVEPALLARLRELAAECP